MLRLLISVTLVCYFVNVKCFDEFDDQYLKLFDVYGEQNSDGEDSLLSRSRRDLRKNEPNKLPVPLSMPGLILAHGYPAEVHHVTTKDGYILELHRIPGPRMVDTSPKKKRRTGRKRRKRDLQTLKSLEDSNFHEVVRSLLKYQNSSIEQINNVIGTLKDKSISLEEKETHLRKLFLKLAELVNADHIETEYDSENFRSFFNENATNASSVYNENEVSLTKNSKVRQKRSNARIHISRNRHLIRTVDPRILMQRNRERRKQQERARSLRVASNRRTIDANAKRSINPNHLGIDFLNYNNIDDIYRFAACLEDKRCDPKRFKDNRSFLCESSKNCNDKYRYDTNPADFDFEQKSAPNKKRNTPNNINNLKINSLLNNEIPGINITFNNETISFINGKVQSKKKVVFLQHCLQCSSADFVLNDHNQALGFILADAGYDVWLGNFRGNQYSRRHISLSPNKVNYWKFKVDDLARYDLPAMIGHVLKVTKSDDLYYIGHSLGTMSFFMATSTNQALMSKIRLMVALAPSGYLDNMRGGLKVLVKTAQSFYRVLEAIGIGEVGAVLPWRGGLMRRFCKPRSPLVGLCSAFLPAVSGRNSGLHDQMYLHLLLANLPSGTSFRLMAQIGQIIGSDGICKFDYESLSENLAVYGQPKPPHYPLEKITCPVAIMWSENDIVCTPVDVAKTAKRLPNLVLNYKVPHATFNHLDFLFADIARTLVYDPILNLMEKY